MTLEDLEARLCDCPEDRTKSYCALHGVDGRLELLTLIVGLMQADRDREFGRAA